MTFDFYTGYEAVQISKVWEEKAVHVKEKLKWAELLITYM